MALDAISNSVYQDPTKLVQKSEVQMYGIGNIDNMTFPAIKKSENTSQDGNQQEKNNKDNAATQQQIKNAISRLNNNMKQSRAKCEFTYHEKINRVSIKIIDEETNEVIREIPPEEALEMITKLWELAGLLIDERR